MTAELRWVSCPAEFSYSGSLTRHLILAGSPTTLCGRTAPQAGVWRSNVTKPKCATCLNRNNGVDEPKPVTAPTPTVTQELELSEPESHEPQPCRNCGAQIMYGQPLYQGHDYWYHVHNHSLFCTLPMVATPAE
jgi:hypothetical protein